MATMQRLVGRPGAGKTQFLRNQVAVWTERDGIDPADIVCTSHTRAAAAVLRGRVPVPEKNCATTHSLANRSIEPRELAEKGKLAREWNDQSGLPESWKIGAAYEDLEEGMVEEHDRGKRLSEYALWRATLWTNRQLEETTRAFAKLESQGLIRRISSRTIEILDVEGLELMQSGPRRNDSPDQCRWRPRLDSNQRPTD